MTTSNFTFSFRLKIFPFIFFLLMGNILFAQVPTIQDCLGAIPICTEIYSETNSPTGSGNYPNEINGISFQNGISCMGDESNSIWYTFTVNQSGDFGFNLTPNNPSDDYDWALFDITNKECEDIFTDISMQVSCNAAGGGSTCTGPTGANGLSVYDVQGFNCNNNPPTQFAGFSSNNAFVPVLIGRTYVLCVSNWTGSTFGYTIYFGVSNDIGIFDNIFPEISDMETPGDCDGEEFIVTFSENIQCNTIDGGNFEIIGTGRPYIATVTSDNCTQGGLYDNVFTVSISPPISDPGSFSITLVSDGVTEVLDLCDNPSTISSFDFEIINIALSDLNIRLVTL